MIENRLVAALAALAIGWGSLWAVVTLGRAVWFLIKNHRNNKIKS